MLTLVPRRLVISGKIQETDGINYKQEPHTYVLMPFVVKMYGQLISDVVIMSPLLFMRNASTHIEFPGEWVWFILMLKQRV